MSKYVVEIHQLSKFYGLSNELSKKIKTFSFGLFHKDGNATHKPALDEITFNVKKGESFGIIGRNGSGKSTLLQIIAGTLKQSSGSCVVNGRLSALLELGSGFNPDFTGKENIFLAGAILGISIVDMERKLPQIEAFAEIGSYIDEPVRTYSTGMLMRVAFAVSIAVEPDILIIDEALSVGDILFQQKCNLRLRELIKSGVTLIVVTHDTSFVLNICTRAMWLHEGKARYLGLASDCVREYLAAMAAISGNNTNNTSSALLAPPETLPDTESLDLRACETLGDGNIYVERVWVLNYNNDATVLFNSGDWICVCILIKARATAVAVSAGCELRDRHGQVVFATGLRVVRRLIDKIEKNHSKLIKIKFKADLAPTQYTLDVGCGAGDAAFNIWHRVKSAAVIEINTLPQDEVIHGFVRLPTQIEVFST